MHAAQIGFGSTALREMFAYGWGAPVCSGGRVVYLRRARVGTTEEVAVTDVKGHMIKHGAVDAMSRSNAPQSVLQQAAHHKNISETRLYQEREQSDLGEYRQAFNAPPLLMPYRFRYSNLDVVGKLCQLELLARKSALESAVSREEKKLDEGGHLTATVMGALQMLERGLMGQVTPPSPPITHTKIPNSVTKFTGFSERGWRCTSTTAGGRWRQGRRGRG